MSTGDGSSNNVKRENPVIEQFYPKWRNGYPVTTRPTLLIFLWFVFGRKSYPKIRTLNIATQSRGRARNGCKILSIVGCYDDRTIDVRRE